MKLDRNVLGRRQENKEKKTIELSGKDSPRGGKRTIDLHVSGIESPRGGKRTIELTGKDYD